MKPSAMITQSSEYEKPWDTQHPTLSPDWLQGTPKVHRAQEWEAGYAF